MGRGAQVSSPRRGAVGWPSILTSRERCSGVSSGLGDCGRFCGGIPSLSRAAVIRSNKALRLPGARTVAGARSMSGSKCQYCSREFRNARGLQVHVRTCRKRSVPLYDNSQSGVGAVGQSSGSAVAGTHSGDTTGITSVTMTDVFPNAARLRETRLA